MLKAQSKSMGCQPGVCPGRRQAKKRREISRGVKVICEVRIPFASVRLRQGFGDVIESSPDSITIMLGLVGPANGNTEIFSLSLGQRG